MKATILKAYGEPAVVLELRDVNKQAPGEGDVLVNTRASSITYGDVALVTGQPISTRLMLGLRAPKIKTPGKDVAGIVEAVGPGVSQFKPGDHVFGDLSECGWGAFAEYVSAPENAFVSMPTNLSFAEAAAVPESGVVALQGLQKTGKIRSGQSVLIVGASGGIGTFAVQIAKAFDTEVTAVSSTRNLDLVSSLGADHLIDYTREDFTRNGRVYDLILATAGYRSIFEYRRVLAPGGHYVATGGEMAQIFQPMLFGSLISKEGRTLSNLTMKPDRNDLTYLKELIEAGKVTPVIDKSFPLSEISAALEYYAEGRSRGKVVVTI